jgi:flagellin-like hook-associated protein FlgL
MPATISDLIKAQMEKTPTNVRLFGQYLSGNTSDITEKDFRPLELEAMRSKIQRQETKNYKDETSLVKSIAALKKETNQTQTFKNGKLVNKYSDAEFGELKQRRIQEAQAKLATYDKDRGKISVSYGDAGGGGKGANALSAIKKSFTSPAYNVETSLGHFNARKNKDGSVTITDTYDYLGYGFDKPQQITMKQFLGSLSRVSSPEQLGTLFARTFVEKSGKKGRKVKITLPSLIKENKCLLSKAN